MCCRRRLRGKTSSFLLRHLRGNSLTQAAAAAVVRLKRAVQRAVSVGDFLPQQAVVMPSVPFAMHFTTAVLAPLTDGAAGQVSLFEAVFLAFVVVNEGSEVAFV